MKNFKKLSREEMKNTFGGLRACKLVIKQADGSYQTYEGTCVVESGSLDFPNGTSTSYSNSYCDTGDGVQHTLTSNGGQSRC